MPTENERKYVLSFDCEREVCQKARKIYEIKQGYLDSRSSMTTRIRRQRNIENDACKAKHYYTHKQKVNGRLIEIETKIDERDFNDLWTTTINKLTKIRYNLLFEHDCVEYNWEIDFFKKETEFGNPYYIVVAEHEMEEGRSSPDWMPPMISRYLVHEVSPWDDRFSSRRLADENYAKQILKSIGENKGDYIKLRDMEAKTAC